MKKRIIALLLTVVMLCSLLPMAAFADDTEPAEKTAISNIVIGNLDNPKENKRLDYEFTVSTTPQDAFVTEGEYAPEVIWTVLNGYTGEWDVIDDPNYVCKPGKTYSAIVCIAPSDDYCFKFKGSDLGSKYTGKINCTSGKSEIYSISGCSIEEGIAITITYNRLYIANSKCIDYVNFVNVPFSYKVGARVDKFTPGTLQTAGPAKGYQHFWYLAKYDKNGELEAIYFADSQIKLGLKSLPGSTKNDILEMRKDFGKVFDDNYQYALIEGIALDEGYGFHGDSVGGSLTFTDGYNISGDHDNDKRLSICLWPITLEADGVVAPSAPVVKISKSNGKIKLSWSEVPGADKYYIYRSTDGKNYKYYSSTKKLTYTNSSVTSGTKYYYKVKAVNVVGKKSYYSKYSSAKSAIMLTTPVVKASLSNGTVKLSWDKVTGATKYEIYRATSKTGEYSKIATTTKTSYKSSSVKEGSTYYYKVKAIKTVGSTNYTSSYSAVKSVMILNTPTLTAANNNGKVKLSWGAVSGADKYYVYRSTDNKTFKYLGSTTKTSYTNSKVTAGTKYYYKVKAVNADGGTSKLSFAKSVVPKTVTG